MYYNVLICTHRAQLVDYCSAFLRINVCTSGYLQKGAGLNFSPTLKNLYVFPALVIRTMFMQEKKCLCRTGTVFLDFWSLLPPLQEGGISGEP